MSQHPINLASRFFLEILALIAIGYGGWAAGEGLLRYLLAIGLPLLMAVLWGAFRTPNEPHLPKHGTFPIPGWVRLLLEAVVFGGGAWGLFSTGLVTTAWIYTLAVLIHYAFSYDRVAWLLRH